MLHLALDENVHIDIITAFRKAGYDIKTVPEANLTGHPDQEILAWAEQEDRVLITGDKDFGGILEFGPLYGKGKVILLRYTTLNISLIIEELLDTLDRESHLFQKHGALIIVLSEGQRRIHLLNQ